MLGVIVSAIMVIMLGYLMVGFSGYLAFPTSVEGNVLKSFPTHDILMQVITPDTSVLNAVDTSLLVQLFTAAMSFEINRMHDGECPYMHKRESGSYCTSCACHDLYV